VDSIIKTQSIPKLNNNLR